MSPVTNTHTTWPLILVLCLAGACSRAETAAPTHTDVRHRKPVGAVARFTVACTIEAAPNRERDASPMCWVPPAAVTIGTPVEPEQREDGPAREVRISRGFYIDQYEVTLAQLSRFVIASGNQCAGTRQGKCVDDVKGSPIVALAPGSFLPEPGKAQRPAYGIAYEVARQYCEWVGRRLPTDAEWEVAARFDPTTAAMRTYPWGNEYAPDLTNCSDCESNDDHVTTSAVGAFARDRSAIGAFDMGGNSDEWVSDCFHKAPPSGAVDPHVTSGCEQTCFAGKPCRAQRLARGAMFGTRREDLESKNRFRMGPDALAGFRCARDK